MKRAYQAHEFAGLAGVTVRALHHYDRLGLLRPARAESGYRMYRERDLERLEQIVALKFVGLPLKQIKALLEREPRDLASALGRQRRVLEDKRALLDKAIRAIRHAESSLASGKRLDTEALRKIIEVIEMQEKTDWTSKYYSPEGQAKVEERKKLWSPELQERVSKQWTELFADVEAALDEDPASPRAQALADRWTKLVEEFTGGDPEITKGVGKVWADRPNWPAQAQEQAKPFTNKKVWEYMGRVMAARKKQG